MKKIFSEITEQELRSIIKEEQLNSLREFFNVSESKKMEDYIEINEAAKIVGLTPGTIRQKTMLGRIPHHKLQGTKKLKFLRSELMEWMNQKNHPGAAN